MEKKVTTRTCDRCKKEFSSGKAFGGHWRSCRVAAKKDRDHDDDSDLKNKFQVRCPVCEKGFSSMKALGGHMRSHPEREWRGINPPRVNDDSPPSDDNLTGPPLLSWIGREKRGRGRDPEIVDAAEVLLDMSRVSKSTVSTPPPFKEATTKLNPSSLKLRIVNTTLDPNHCSKGKLIAAGDKYCDGDDGMKMENKRKKKMMMTMMKVTEESSSDFVSDSDGGHRKISVDDDNGSADLLYKCVDCEKSFSSFQGLGGHRSTHNRYVSNNKKISSDHKPMLRIENNIATSVNSNNRLESTTNASPILANNQEEKENQIPVNHHQKKLNFPTNKPLNNLPRDFEPHMGSTDTEASTARGLAIRGHSVCDFDLNEVP